VGIRGLGGVGILGGGRDFGCTLITTFCCCWGTGTNGGGGGLGSLTTGVSVMLVDCLQEIHSNQLSFLGVKWIGQHRNLQQPKICSHDMHLPQVKFTVSVWDGCNAIASFCSGRGVGGVGILTTGAGAILADCLQEIHSNQLSFLGVKCVGQHRNLQQPKICSHDMHLPQVHSTMSGLDGSSVVGKHLYIQHLQFFSHAAHSLTTHVQFSSLSRRDGK
jgi:hypothetical protein